MKYMWLTGTTGERMSGIYLCTVKNRKNVVCCEEFDNTVGATKREMDSKIKSVVNREP